MNWAYPIMPPSVQSQAMLAGRCCGFFHKRPKGLHYTPLPSFASTFTFPLYAPFMFTSPMHSFPLQHFFYKLNRPPSYFA